MLFRKSRIAVLFAASLGALAAPLAADAAATIYLNIGPPEPRYEAVPAPRAGYVWAPGYWHARNNSHYWQAGHWERSRPGYHYVQPNWTPDNRWKFNNGYWNKGDRDGDGVPNNRDRQPDNPRRS